MTLEKMSTLHLLLNREEEINVPNNQNDNEDKEK
jgi:hypothetical protein